jgi:hypothetical protein
MLSHLLESDSKLEYIAIILYPDGMFLSNLPFRRLHAVTWAFFNRPKLVTIIIANLIHPQSPCLVDMHKKTAFVLILFKGGLPTFVEALY